VLIGSLPERRPFSESRTIRPEAANLSGHLVALLPGFISNEGESRLVVSKILKVTPSHGSITSSTSPMKILIWRSRTPGKLHGTMVLTSEKDRGTIRASTGGREENRNQTRFDVNRGGMK
jgi:hypothetical protein